MNIAYHPYRYREDFSCLDTKNTPAGILIEENSQYTHKHARAEGGSFFISCRGNKFLCRTPRLTKFSASVTLGYHSILKGTGATFFFGYDRASRCGYALDAVYDGSSLVLRMLALGAKTEQVLDSVCIEGRGWPDVSVLTAECDGCRIWGLLDGDAYSFELPEARAGLLGVTFNGAVGEMSVREIDIETSEDIKTDVIASETKAVIPLRNGGNMPYTLTYGLTSAGGLLYLDYRFDGGPQYRSEYPDYPRNTDQYCVERDIITDPFIALYDVRDGACLLNRKIFSGDLVVSDPGITWGEILRPYFGIKDLPMSGTLVFDASLPSCEHLQIGFGYEAMNACGYQMQSEHSVEFVFDFASAALVYEGKARGTEHLNVTSHSDTILSRIPESVCDYEKVVSHLEKNHFFAKGEPIVFRAEMISDKPAAYLDLAVQLQDVYGDAICEMTVERTDGVFVCSAESPDIGVYRAAFAVTYGGIVLLTREIVFEVCGETNDICPPLASGLPFLFSMPNEDRYLDRDAFDLYNPVPDCNMEHFYACSSMTGDIGVRRRIWETNRLFGRSWYVWLSDHRTLTTAEFKEWEQIILENSDYCYYPLKYEWAVMRHDPCRAYNYTPGIMEYLHAFLDDNPAFRPLIAKDATGVSQEELDGLLNVCYNEWIDYVNARIIEDAAEDNRRFTEINPALKRACYGPFPIYTTPMVTHNAMRMIGHECGESLAKEVFNGFAQLEDYPYSCTYHTYEGPFFLSNVLLHIPGLCVYPEEYTSSIGGCIDGAVKNANPPLGKYDMPPYFNITHAYEYVYNTAYLNENGFDYWRSYGFMQRDFVWEFVDEFVRGWKHVPRHEPARPLRSTAYLSEIPRKETVYAPAPYMTTSNRSEVGLAYLYETARLGGLPNGFTLNYAALETLTAAQTDCIVLPSLTEAPESAIAHLRKLYKEGVSLIAVGDVGGLEDLFGVRCIDETYKIGGLADANGRNELIFPDDAHFTYAPTDAEIVLSAVTENGKTIPVVVRKGRTLLVTAPMDQLGHASFASDCLVYAQNISRLFREVMTEQLHALSAPTAVSDNCGITLLEDEHGNTLLLAVDYSDYDAKDLSSGKLSRISLHLDDVVGVGVIHGEKAAVCQNDGIVREIGVTLRGHECALLRLMRK